MERQEGKRPLNGAEIVIECLKKEKVEFVFGYPGGAVLPLYDALYLDGFPHILPKHEQTAAHAADGYARATGRTGVCLATSGPGATNLITGIATAYMDSVPMVIITGQVIVPLIGRDSFQEADTSGITTPITKHNYLVKDVAHLARTLKEAFFIAGSGRPGPVLVDIARDVFVAVTEFEYPETVCLKGYTPLTVGSEDSVAALSAALQAAAKPLFFIGGGVNLSDTSPLMREILDYTGAPAVTSLMGYGCVANDDPHFFGMIGMHGTYAGNLSTKAADLLIGCGVRFDDRVTGLLEDFATKAKIAHMDIDPAEINKNVVADLKVVGDLRWSLQSLLRRLKEIPREKWRERFDPWRNQMEGWRQEQPLGFTQRNNYVMPQAVIGELSRLADRDAVLVTDVGQHQMWAAQFFSFKNPRTFVTSGGLGTMGFGLPAAIGVQIGCPGRQVVCVSGDGGFMMNCQELSTLADLSLPVKLFILNNRYLGMVAQWQRNFFGGRYACSYIPTKTDFVRLAESMGVRGLRVSSPALLPETLREALDCDGPVLTEIIIPEDEDVLPMVPAGARLDQMILGGLSR
ncbi:MAG: biosynthetic-type acetolactate synthase large subunit [Gracilibacteraceae bacterium]|jgi:acetolactate synthase-1/2/3 large subunit|nr:biosynthetic-type acetolactate synthase large subunit [Gracilibacteraceae bacterium]